MANIEQKFREACVQSGLASMIKQLNNPALNGLISATLGILKQSAGGNTVTGTVKSVGQTVNVSKTGNEFKKRELILDISRYNPDTGEKYENYVQMSFTQKHCDDLNGLSVGDKVEVAFTVSGREWNGKIINDIVGLRVERIGAAPTAAPTAPATAPIAQEPTEEPIEELPF